MGIGGQPQLFFLKTPQLLKHIPQHNNSNKIHFVALAIAVIVSSLNGGVNGLLHLSIYKVKLNYFWKKINLYPANPSPEAKRILVAPLDWGLGHATRCIPLIRALLDAGCEVLIGAEDRQAALLVGY